MPRLYRPHISLEVECRVAMRQLGELWPDDCIAAARKARILGPFRRELLTKLAALLGCELLDLRLDHDPALGLRKRKGEGKATVYDPPANDPSFLFFRPHGAQFDGSHDVKTRIRGDHGQYSDLALMKRERRRQRRAKPVKRRVGFGRKNQAWPKGRKMKSASRWPPKGSRKINRRQK